MAVDEPVDESTDGKAGRQLAERDGNENRPSGRVFVVVKPSVGRSQPALDAGCLRPRRRLGERSPDEDEIDRRTGDSVAPVPVRGHVGRERVDSASRLRPDLQKRRRRDSLSGKRAGNGKQSHREEQADGRPRGAGKFATRP